VERDGHPGDGKRFKVNRDGRGVGECWEEFVAWLVVIPSSLVFGDEGVMQI
jgi:hypothetical protein